MCDPNRAHWEFPGHKSRVQMHCVEAWEAPEQGHRRADVSPSVDYSATESHHLQPPNTKQSEYGDDPFGDGHTGRKTPGAVAEHTYTG